MTRFSTVEWFHTLLLNINNSVLYQAFTPIRVKWLRAFLFDMINSINQVFLSNTNNLYTAV